MTFKIGLLVTFVILLKFVDIWEISVQRFLLLSSAVLISKLAKIKPTILSPSYKKKKLVTFFNINSLNPQGTVNTFYKIKLSTVSYISIWTYFIQKKWIGRAKMQQNVLFFLFLELNHIIFKRNGNLFLTFNIWTMFIFLVGTHAYVVTYAGKR